MKIHLKGLRTEIDTVVPTKIEHEVEMVIGEERKFVWKDNEI